MSTVLTQDDDHTTITVDSGGEVGLHLEENPTTGFQWSFEELSAPLELVHDEYHLAGTPLVPGAGGVHEWRFKAAEPGSYQLRMRYSQAWDETAADRRFAVDIVAV